MSIVRLKTSTLQDAVYEELVQSILSGQLKPGEKITMDDFAKQMSVSLMPVREAFRRLESRRFIVIEKNRRAKIAELTKNNFDQIFRVRMILECEAAEKASVLRTDESIIELEKAHKKYLEARDIEELLQANREFHGIIYREAQLHILDEVIYFLWERVTPYFCIYFSGVEDWKKDNTHVYHAGMLEGMKNKNPIEVKKWLKDDLNNTVKRIETVMK